MSTFIGTRSDTALSCGDGTHLPGCYNPQYRGGCTACLCGAVWWPGQVGTWHCNDRYAPEPLPPLLGVGIGAPGLSRPGPEFLGWDVYFLHAPACTERDEPHAAGRCFAEAVTA